MEASVETMRDILEKLLVAIIAGMILRSLKDVSLIIVKLASYMMPTRELRLMKYADWSADVLEKESDDKKIIGALWIIASAPSIAITYKSYDISRQFNRLFKALLRFVVVLQGIGSVILLTYLLLGWGKIYLYGYILQQYLSAESRGNISSYILDSEQLSTNLFAWFPLTLVALVILKSYVKDQELNKTASA
jgi:uncharacterized membrane protein YraQ (UPF0718 family)